MTIPVEKIQKAVERIVASWEGKLVLPASGVMHIAAQLSEGKKVGFGPVMGQPIIFRLVDGVVTAAIVWASPTDTPEAQTESVAQSESAQSEHKPCA